MSRCVLDVCCLGRWRFCFCQAEDGIRDLVRSRGLGDVYKRQRQNQRADRATLELIAERVEGNLLAAHQEIGKLGLLFPEGELPPEETRAAVLDVARYDAFDLVAARGRR